MGIYVGNSEIQSVYIGTTPVKEVYVGTTKIRPTQYTGPELCFTANTAGSTIKLNKNSSPTAVTLEYTKDGTWNTYTFGDTITLTNVGDAVFFRNTSTSTTGLSSTGGYYQFVMTGSIAASGDVNYLINKNSTTSVSAYCYYRLFFGCSQLTSAPTLSATTVGNYSYNQMFYNCTGITVAPALPAMTLGEYCYQAMFQNTRIVTAPELNAYMLKANCYNQMFRQCTSLTTAPKLPATNLQNYCYYNMFYQCTNLTSLPALPATTLRQSCYAGMFQGCSKIKLSTTQTGEYQTAYRIPKTGTGSTASDALFQMFTSTGGTFTGQPAINYTYYTSNTVIS